MFFRIGLIFRGFVCVLPQSYHHIVLKHRNERMSLCASKRGSLTVEASLILPFFIMILLGFFTFFSQYSTALQLKAEASAEAKKVGIVLGGVQTADTGDVTIYKSAKGERLWIYPFQTKNDVVQSAVCRAWIGFTELEEEETYVYVTPDGSVYHLYGDCTHLNLSIQKVSFPKACVSRNEYGEKYRPCELCKGDFGALVYITSEGNCYHSERSCSGLKRTIRQIPLSEAKGRGCCIRCMSRKE